MMALQSKLKGMGGHHRGYEGGSDCWLTPPEIVRSLDPFDLDPCCPPSMPWETAKFMYSLPVDDGLVRPWFGRVWLNPPYGAETGDWLARLADHGNGIALIFARTETEMFFDHVWNRAGAVLFIKGRLHFHTIGGDRAKANAGAPSVLVAYGARNVKSLQLCGIAGQFVPLNGSIAK